MGVLSGWLRPQRGRWCNARRSIPAAFELLEERTLLAGIWIDHQELMALPTSGASWENVLAAAQQQIELPNLQAQDEVTDVLILAKALVGVRLNDQSYISQSREAIMSVVGTETNDGTVTIANPAAIETTATFSEPGTYLLRLMADDGQLDDEDEQTIRVHAAGDVFTPTGAAALDASGQITITGASGGNNDPDVYAGADQIVSINDVVTLRGGVEDDGLPSGNVTVTWEVVQPRTLALGRNLVSYVIAADLVGLEPADDAVFRDWLAHVLTVDIDGRTLQSAHEDRPNNWGTMAGASRAAVALYLGDQVELDRTAQVFKGYLGDRSAYAGFTYGDDLSWQADPASPVAINPLGATKDGHSIDGAQPEEMRRGGPFQFPPAETQYPWEALQGSIVTAEILHRAGYDAWQWQDQAILRATQFLYGLGWPPNRDDQWSPWVLDARYQTDFAVEEAVDPGKNMGWTSWTHHFAAPGENQPPIVAAGADQVVQEGVVIALNGSVSDDGRPDPPANVATQWTLKSGPESATATFADATALDSTVEFSGPGTFVLQLSADDGEFTTTDDVVFTVVSSGELITVSLQDGLNGYTGTRDTRIRSDQATTNFGTSLKLELDGNPDQVSLIRWDTSGIPTASTITSASLTFNVLKASNDDYEVYEALRTWDELTATYHLASTGQAWEVPGAAGPTDHAADVLASLTAPSTGTVTIDLNDQGLAMVRRWVSDPSNNYGIVIQDLTDATTDDLDVSAREDSGLGPMLAVTYTLATIPKVESVVVGDSTPNSNRSGVAKLAWQFDQAATVSSAAALRVYNHTAGSPIDLSAATLLDNGTSTVTWNLSSVTLPDGRYTAELPAADAISAAGSPLANTHTFEFFVLRGDVNGDGAVDTSDYAAVGSSFDPLPGAAYRAGDANGDGKVNFADYGVIGRHFNSLGLASLTYDLGDSPEASTNYPTTFANDGAVQVIGSGLFLGSGVDSESDGQPDADALGDDSTGDDEDGVTFGNLTAGSDASITVVAEIPATSSAVLNAWVDFNGDGDWNDPGEQIFINEPLDDGSNALSFSVPAAAAVGDTFARFRVTTCAGYSFNGLAPDGEVEDYKITIAAANALPEASFALPFIPSYVELAYSTYETEADDVEQQSSSGSLEPHDGLTVVPGPRASSAEVPPPIRAMEHTSGLWDDPGLMDTVFQDDLFIDELKGE